MYQRNEIGHPPPDLHLKKMNELFKGTFKDVAIYLMTLRDEDYDEAQHDIEYYPALYAVDNRSGKFITFTDNNAFCAFVNTTQRPLTNLDKACLYICLYVKIFTGSFYLFPPASYRAEISGESKFANDSLIREAFEFPESNSIGCPCSGKTMVESPPYRGDYNLMCSDCLYSSVNKIAIYATIIKCDPLPIYYKYNFHFNFDGAGNLTGIVTDTVPYNPHDMR